MPTLGNLNDLKSLDKHSAVIVSASDTTYGLHSRSLERLQHLKNRMGSFIHLVNSIQMTKELCLVTNKQRSILEKYWPGPITFILKDKLDQKKTIATRLPESLSCVDMIRVFQGPVLSTSCNAPGEKPVTTIQQAVDLFGDLVDLYIDSGTLVGTPSTIVDLTQNPAKIIRQGTVYFNENHQEHHR